MDGRPNQCPNGSLPYHGRFAFTIRVKSVAWALGKFYGIWGVFVGVSYGRQAIHEVIASQLFAPSEGTIPTPWDTQHTKNCIRAQIRTGAPHLRYKTRLRARVLG